MNNQFLRGVRFSFVVIQILFPFCLTEARMFLPYLLSLPYLKHFRILFISCFFIFGSVIHLFYFFVRVFVLSSQTFNQTTALRKRNPYSKLFWCAFFPDFLAFGLNTERYRVSLRIRSECGKIREKCGPK